MRKHFKYLAYVLCHKYYVMKACFHAKLYWRGLVHDLSKLLPSEWFPYVNHFHGPWAEEYMSDDDSIDPPFDFAWLQHQKRNDHHWQYWILREDDGKTKVFPMPPDARMEMACDWLGANLAQGGTGLYGPRSVQTWYSEKKGCMLLHKDTRKWVEEFLGL